MQHAKHARPFAIRHPIHPPTFLPPIHIPHYACELLTLLHAPKNWRFVPAHAVNDAISSCCARIGGSRCIRLYPVAVGNYAVSLLSGSKYQHRRRQSANGAAPCRRGWCCYCDVLTAAAAPINTPDVSGGPAQFSDGADASPPAPKQSLYDILRCPPTATKAELKRSYVLLAKQTHPDAQIGRTPEQIAEMEADPLIPSFHEVSGAWKVLSDEKERKRYDRSLKADEFVESAEKWAATISDGAGSILSKTWQSQLSPFIKRTVSTVNNANAAFREELGESSESDNANASKKSAGVGQYWKAAVEAARQAGRSISQQDMYEKAAELDERGKF